VETFEIIIPRNRLNATVTFIPGDPTIAPITTVFPLGLFYTLHPDRDGVEIRQGNGRNVTRRSAVARNGPAVSLFRDVPNPIVFSNGATREVSSELFIAVVEYLSSRAAAPDAGYSESTPEPESVRIQEGDLVPRQVVLTSGGRRSRRRLMSRTYCKRTPCRKMGFTQKASCRPTKNCYRRTKRRGRNNL
jgi:hypothetical protein